MSSVILLLSFQSLAQCDYNADVTVTPANEVFFSQQFSNNSQTFCGNLFVTDGAILNVTHGALLFRSTMGIYIMPGCRMTVNGTGSILSNNTINNNTEWRGVEVRGVSNLPPNAPQQGSFELKEGRLHNAEIGVSSFDRTEDIMTAASGGGEIDLVNAQLRNNRQHVVLSKYAYSNNGSTFLNCDFLWDSSGPFANHQGFAPSFELYANDILIHGCQFINTNVGVFYTASHTDKSAIHASGDSQIRVFPVGSNNRIEGFQYGVVVFSNMPSRIENMDFNCYRGIWMVDAISPVVRGNDFGHINPVWLSPPVIIDSGGPVPPSQTVEDNQYGIYLENCTGYTVSANSIDFSLQGLEREAGIYVYSSGSANNLITDNHISWCEGAAIRSVLDNRNSTGTKGLKLQCNELLNNRGGIHVLAIVPDVGMDQGIHRQQGTPLSPFQMQSSGNTFNANGGDMTDNDPTNGHHIWNVLGLVGHVDYYYQTADGLAEADDIGNIAIHTNFAGVSVIPNQNCMQMLQGGAGSNGNESTDHRTSAMSHWQQASMYEADFISASTEGTSYDE